VSKFAGWAAKVGAEEDAELCPDAFLGITHGLFIAECV
jgi:hypothetical protein